MSVELWSIIALVLMLLAVTLVQGALVPATQGFKWGLGSRDEPRDNSALQGRFARTVQNHIEAMLMHIPLVTLVVLTERTTEATEIAAWLVIAGRFAFIPFYLFGIFGLRSVAYTVALVGIFITAGALLV